MEKLINELLNTKINDSERIKEILSKIKEEERR